MKCEICNIEIDDPKSNICGHPTCIMKKTEQMFK